MGLSGKENTMNFVGKWGIRKDAGGYGNLDMANQHESDKETPIRVGRDENDSDNETYIGLPARKDRAMTLNKIQHTKVGDDIHFYVNGEENRGIVVKMGGSFVSVFKEDGNIHDIPINDTFFVKDIVVNKTWDSMNMEERTEALQKAHAPSPRFLHKNWNDLPRELREIIAKGAEDELGDVENPEKPLHQKKRREIHDLEDKAIGMEENHDGDNLEKESAEHVLTGYSQKEGAPVSNTGRHRERNDGAGGKGLVDAINNPNSTRGHGDGKTTPPRTNFGINAARDSGGKTTPETQTQGKIHGSPMDAHRQSEIALPTPRGGSPAVGEDARQTTAEGRDTSPELDNPTKLKSSLDRIQQLKSDVEHGAYGNAARNPHVGVSTDTNFDAPKDYEAGSEPNDKEQFKHEKKKPEGDKKKTVQGEGGQTGAVNNTETAGVYNPKFNAYDTNTITPESQTGRKIQTKDQLTKGIPVKNVNTWGINYTKKVEKDEDNN